MPLQTTPMASPTEEQQEKLLDESLGIVKVQSFQMKCCLDKGKLMEALKHASNMLSELRTSLLSPKSYYELYMSVTDQLRHLEMYLLDEFQRGRKMADLYELVQYAGNIIPRLYLLITVGLVYMKTTPGCRKDILKDLVEMCRGVQHPLRGLFLRNYLLQSCRNVLPDVTEDVVLSSGDPKEDKPGCVQDSIDFILLNFAEMNKLWVRMQHIGHTRDKDRREKERLELRLLVGTNLVRLSQLESVDLEVYKKVVLPGILEQVVSCRDSIAQEYLMECLIQVFPDEFHLATLQPFLNSCAQLTQNVNVKNIIIALIDRLAMSKDIELPHDLFDIFAKQISQIIQTRTDISLEDIFFKLPFNYGSSNGVTGLSPIKMSLKLSAYKDLLKETAAHDLHKEVTLSLINSALENNAEEAVEESDRLTLEEMEVFLSQICDPLINGKNSGIDIDENDEDFIDEQLLLSRFIHFLFLPQSLQNSTQLDNYYLLLSSARKILSSGGPKRIRYTYPSLVFEALKLALKYSAEGDSSEDRDPKWEKKCQKIFQFVNQTIGSLMKESNCSELCLKLFLQSAQNAAKTKVDNRETIAYEFISQAFSIYEEEINDFKSQLFCLLLIISTVKEIKFEIEDNYSPLKSQCCLNGAKLVKKSDQIRAILAASLLFVDYENNTIESDLMKCIKKCYKIASNVLDIELQLQLYVEILSHLTLLLRFNDKDIEELCRQLVEKIDEQSKETALSELIQRQYSNNISLLKHKNIVKSSD
ncbi:unnamed protein product [Oppiella nova]|uniref:Vacuolar protein sorting-associated protein 35 n=2 Tax=Oppiella nova TaxID=334625 RepID=A0A7R9LLU8_9ACAR|nr:unnamed protein product [Oppiella nova]CAG2164930.1 unnamed protein product [Oppiella nova]